MRRLMAIAAFALFLAIPLRAQRGGGHGGGGGGHAGFGGGHAGGFSGHAGFSGGGHFSGGMHSAPFSRGFNSRGYSSRGFNPGFSARSREPFLHGSFPNSRFNGRGSLGNRAGFGNRGNFGNRNRFGFRGNYYGWGRRGWGWGYPYWGWGYYDPWLWDWWDSDSSYDNDYYQNLEAANEMNQQSLEEQQMLRQEEADGDQDAYAPPPYRSPQYNSRSNSGPNSGSNSSDKGQPFMRDTVLVYRDQHRQEIQNYAIIGQTLWNFAPDRTQKIPLSELDLTATIKANEDQGITFDVPSSNQGQ